MSEQMYLKLLPEFRQTLDISSSPCSAPYVFIKTKAEKHWDNTAALCEEHAHFIMSQFMTSYKRHKCALYIYFIYTCHADF